MTIEPIINLAFHRAMHIADPRMTIARASTGGGISALGRPTLYPINTLRPCFNPITGVGEGFLPERQSTNLLLRSEEADHALWTKTTLTVGANAATAPDNTTTADSLTATGASGAISQAVTITAGRGLSVSVHAKAFASNFLYVKITDGGNTVECWFNLSTGAVASNTAGASTCVFSQKGIEPYFSGWYRCFLDVTTATSTAFTISFGPAASDGAQPANTNSIYWWGAQAESEVTSATAASSYYPTAGATATRNADNIHLPTTFRGYNQSEGAMVFEFVNRRSPATASGSHVLGGIANTFADVMYLSRTNTSTITLSFASSLGGTGSVSKTGYSFAAGVVNKVAVAWATNDVAIVVNGGSPDTYSSTFVVPTNFARIGLGCVAWSTSDNGNKAHASVRTFKYFGRRLSTANMQLLTAA